MSNEAPRQPTSGILRATVLAVGVLCGLSLFALGYGDGWAYMIDNPQSCANCHVMQGHLDSYLQSSHQRVATCNDCHLRHDFVGKWMTKADNGFFHSVAFTTGYFHEPIQIKARNRRVTQSACLHCHQSFVNETLPAHAGGETLLCVRCHADVGHALR